MTSSMATLTSPPGQVRAYPAPSKSAKVFFSPSKTSQVCETAYSLYGSLNSSHTPLICLHGGPGTPGRYLKPISLLSKDRGIPVILYDQIGCGDSTHLPHTKGDSNFWTFDIFIQELRNLIAKLGITQYDLFGHNFGGMLASTFALTQPPGLRKLIICGSEACVAVRTTASRAQLAQFPPEIRAAFENAERSGTTDSPEFKHANVELFKRHVCRLDPSPAELIESFRLAQEDTTVKLSTFGQSMVNVTGPCKSFDITERLNEITAATVPGGVLLINGKYDSIPDEVMEPFFTNIKARVKWIQFAESSHMPMLEETERFVSNLGQFLQLA